MLAHLRQHFPAPAELEGRPRSDNVSRRDNTLICVWFPGWERITRDMSLAAPTLKLNAWPGRSKVARPTQTNPGDELEVLSMKLLNAFPRATEVVGFFGVNLSSTVLRLTPNYDDDVYRVEGDLQGYTITGGA